MKQNHSELTLIALGLIFSGIVIIFFLSNKPSLIIYSTDHPMPAESSINIETTNDPTSSEINLSEKININIATADELNCLPGIGEIISSRIIEYRESQGSFLSVDELLNVKGISDKKLEKIKPYISL